MQQLERSVSGGRAESDEQVAVIGQVRKDKGWDEAVTMGLQSRKGEASDSEVYARTSVE